MKRNSIVSCTMALVLVVCAVSVPSVFGATRQDEAAPSMEDAALVQVVSSTQTSATFRVNLPRGRLTIGPVDRDGYVGVAIPGAATISEAGAPALPFVARSIGVPFGAALSVQVEPGAAHVIALPGPVRPAASQRVEFFPGSPDLPQPLLSLVEDASIYRGEADYPGVLARVVSDAVMRQQRVAGIAAYPVQYRPAARELVVYDWLAITVTFTAAGPAVARDGVSPRAESEPESAPYEKVLACELLNYQDARQWRQSVAPAVTGKSPSAAASLAFGERTGASAQALGATIPWAPPNPGWRIPVPAEGIYRLTYSELGSAGLPVANFLPVGTFQLFNAGLEVPIDISDANANGVFESGDSLLFYGQALTSKYSADNIYWLTYGAANGQRMAKLAATPKNAETPAYFAARRRLETNSYYVSGAPGDETLEHWMSDYLYPSSKPNYTTTFVLSAPYVGPSPAILRVALLGYLQNSIKPDHHVRISLNGVQVADVRWDGIAWNVVEVLVPADRLLAGTNPLQATDPNDTGVGYDIVYVDWAELAFDSRFVAENNSLAFDYAAGTWSFSVTGFSTNDPANPVAVYDVTNPASPIRLTGVDTPKTGQTYGARFQTTLSGATRYLATSTYKSAQSIEMDTPSTLGSTTNGADYIVITHKNFATQAARLRDLRAGQGLRARSVDVQDVYDEFGYGISSPAAIRDFLAHSYASWAKPAPTYVVLVGDGNYDPKNYTNSGRVSYIPPYLAPVDPWIGETAADNRYVTLVGADTVPDMMLGRLSVNNSMEAGAFVDKIVAYESPPAGDWRTQVLAVADNADNAGNFPQISDNLLNSPLLSSYSAAKVYYGTTHTTVHAARAAIQAGINAGKLLVNFIGHGSPDQWASESLLDINDMPLLTNGAMLPVMLPMTCYDGYYHRPMAAAYEALGEVITRAAGKGAVASWSPTGLGVATGHDYLDRGFFAAVFAGSDARVTLGQATNSGKLSLSATGSNLDLLDTYLLFGDPATRVPVLPTAAAVAPEVGIASGAPASAVMLTWPSILQDSSFEVWRSTVPYFDPAEGQGNQIAELPGLPAEFAQLSYTDVGIDQFHSDPDDPQLPPVQILGDPSTNYFWVVRGRNSSGVSSITNRVGEFEFGLVSGD